jgi:hypothetical protein
VSVNRPEPIYPVKGRSNEGYVAFVGEPVILQVTLVNHTTDTIRVTAGSPGWIGLLSVRFESLAEDQTSPRNIAYSVVRLVNRITGGTADPTSIGPSEAQELRIRLQANQVPTSGAHRIRVTLPRTSVSNIPQRSLVRLVATETIYVRAVESTSDELNVLYAAGVQARLDGRRDEARVTLRRLLAKQPESMVGWYELGLSWAEEGECQQAAAAFRQATALVERRADPNEASAQRGTRGMYVREMKRVLSNCPG